MKKKLLKALGATSTLFLSSLALSGCTHYDYTLVIYNWEDYIFEGTDEYGNIVEDTSYNKDGKLITYKYSYDYDVVYVEPMKERRK